MILAQCQSASQTVVAYQQFKARSTRLDSIQATGSALTKVEKTLAPLSIYQALRNFIPVERQEEIQRTAKQLADRLQSLQRNFSNELDQRGQLGNLQSSAETFEKKVKEAWTNYALPMVTDLEKSYVLVKHVPKVQQKEQYFVQELVALTRIATSLPTQQAHISDFHMRVQRVRNDVESVGDLAPSQKLFLERVNQGNATVADITPELLQWLKTQGMDSNLRLSL